MSVLPLLLSFALTSLSVSSNSTFTCPTRCKCHLGLKFTSCGGANLTDLPSVIPPFTEHLNLSFNHLLFIGNQAFQDVRRLHTLLLNDNRISNLTDGAFEPLEFLVRLDLSRNRISMLSKGFSLGLMSLRELSLVQNQLLSINEHCFSHLDSIRKLDLRHNSINHIHVRAFISLSTLRHVFLDHNKISNLKNRVFSMTRNLEELGLSGNNIRHLKVGILSPLTSLALLNLTFNNLTNVNFKAFLSLDARSTHIYLHGNPWTCDCDLQRVFRKIRSVHRLQLDDYNYLSCYLPEELRDYPLKDVDNKLCFAETVTVLIITVTVIITVVAAIIMAEKKRKKINKGKHWTEVGEISSESQN
ncbi:leucine-rich repeat-containing protein 3B [Tachysurus ichikawai]